MSGDKLAFLDETQPEVGETPEETPTEEVEAQPEAEPTPEPPAEPEPTQEETGEPPATPPVAEPEPQKAPITALLDEREKRQAAQSRAEQLERRLAQIERDKTPPPDFLEDPDKRFQYEARGMQRAQDARFMALSRFNAEDKFGKEVVAEAYAFFDANPQLSQQLMEHPSPFHRAVEVYQQHKFLSEVKDPEQWREQERERIRAEERERLTAEISQQSKPTPPPASLSTAPSVGKDATPPGTGFDQLFPD